MKTLNNVSHVPVSPEVPDSPWREITVTIHDKNGLWGSIKVEAMNPVDAEEKARYFAAEEDIDMETAMFSVRPDGMLLAFPVSLADGTPNGFLLETNQGDTVATLDESEPPEWAQGNAARIRDTWNACHGLDLPAEVEPGILADVVANLEEFTKAEAKGWKLTKKDRDARLARALATLAKLAPVSPSPQ